MNTRGKSLDKLYSYCKDRDWSGYDPFDGLSSRLFAAVPLVSRFRIARLAFLQLNKKMPLNLRPLLLIRRGRNPKGIGLFLYSLSMLYQKYENEEYRAQMEEFRSWLQKHVSLGYRGNCWGYNFDWQSRAFFLPKGTPTVVNTSYIGRAFLKYYEVTQEKEALQIARSACDFILGDLNRKENERTVAFSYSPLDHYFVHNATALGASLLSAVYGKTGEEILVRVAKKAIQSVIDKQQPSGSWFYGESKTARGVGIDSFHTGFILECLKIYTENTGDKDYEKALRKGLKFYQDHFFLPEGAPKYYPDREYPMDIHSAAQAIITLIQLRPYGADQNLRDKIYAWMMQNLYDRNGYFYYQKHRFYTNRIAYMRWGQAWAFRALVEYDLAAGRE